MTLRFDFGFRISDFEFPAHPPEEAHCRSGERKNSEFRIPNSEFER